MMLSSTSTPVRVLAVVGGLAVLAIIMGVIFTIGRSQFGLEVVKTNPGSDPSAWTVFDAPIEHFQIAFPSYPSESTGSYPATSTLDAVPYTEYTAKDVNGDYYAVSVETFPINTDVASSAFLDSLVSSAVESANGTSVKKQSGTYRTIYPSLDYSYKSGNYYVRARAIQVDASIYFVEVISDGNTFPNFDAFAASLNFTGAA